ncbi:NAD(P)/FAD-dependent oxidoreductase [Catenisphaera adipataccumulans]|jgi:glycerol-3-phosphate dehydrogenase|uniref:Glycerol-3-phosphate dehydrogenase n=1 Tax=Catenisphaera adipataccumulans TaxID=700500 RepID=A0A7W8CVD8_9FIRM|nr:NAD(P)/FAD-dependent oxidoreductase [Catenisphaera adipataccumulans]MBB5182295.1 glycerol-3-phosphate dehydrogenase [Catenisphaera adipataccumulans]
MYDVVIIGAGVSGCAAARELSRYNVSACVVERADDVCEGTSKANSAIIHAGYDAKEGSLMAKLNVEGNQMMTKLSEDLDIPFKRIGSFVVCTDEKERGGLEMLLERGKKNGVPDLRIVEQDELRKMEPNISDDAVAALYAPTAGIVCPFELTIALAENAVENGVEFKLETTVENIEKTENGYLVKTDRGDIETKCVVNAAGVYADRFHNMVSEKKMTIIPRKGEYYLLDKSAGQHVSHTIFAQPTKMGKGVLVTPTVHGNLLVGPTALDIENKEGVNTTYDGLQEVGQKSGRTVKNLPLRDVITSFAGLRAHEEHGDFIIEEVKDAPGFFDCAGMASPGLSASPAVGKMIADMLRDKLNLSEKANFKATRKGIVKASTLSIEERNELIKKDPKYGNIICRCEMVSEGEIVDAIHRPIPARSLDAIKRRTRAGMGRCQAGFCSPRVMEILSREVADINMENVTKAGGKSRFIVGTNKDRW